MGSLKDACPCCAAEALQHPCWLHLRKEGDVPPSCALASLTLGWAISEGKRLVAQERGQEKAGLGLAALEGFAFLFFFPSTKTGTRSIILKCYNFPRCHNERSKHQSTLPFRLVPHGHF